MTDPLDFMPSCSQREILARHLLELRSAGDVSGVLLSGSFARGDSFRTSDLDINILLRDGCERTFSANWEEGILVELSYFDFEKALKNLQSKPMFIYTFLEGRILHDPHGRLQELAREARNLMESFSHSPKDLIGIAHWLRSAVVKVTAAQDAGDLVKASYVATTNSHELLVGLWAINNKPIPACGGVMAHLKDLAVQPTHIPNWFGRLFNGESADRLAVFNEVSDWLIKRLE